MDGYQEKKNRVFYNNIKIKEMKERKERKEGRKVKLIYIYSITI